MDGDPLGEPDESPRKYGEVFDEVFPQYLFYGMSADEFWRGDPSLARAYRKAHEMSLRRRNWEMWMQGAYIYDALLCVAPVFRTNFSKSKPEPGKYPEKPWPITERDAREQEQQEQRARMERMLAVMNAESELAAMRRKQQEQRKEAEEHADGH